MQRIVQHRETLLYLTESGEWCNSRMDADRFPSLASAALACWERGISADVDVLVSDGRGEVRMNLFAELEENVLTESKENLARELGADATDISSATQLPQQSFSDSAISIPSTNPSKTNGAPNRS